MIKINRMPIEVKTFGNGEKNINGTSITNALDLKEDGLATVEFKYENDADLIELMLVKKQLDKLRIEAELKILYMPYSRMDRVADFSQIETLKYVANFINDLNFAFVGVIEPHSDVTTALLNNCVPVYPTGDLLMKAIDVVDFSRDKDYIMYPDAGAQKRYYQDGYKFVKADKQRDPHTGRIKNLKVFGNIKKGSKVIIVDDICSYGGTFKQCAEQLKEKGASEVYLVVTHCEDSVHHGELLNGNLISGIFTTNSILTQPHPKIHVFDLFN